MTRFEAVVCVDASHLLTFWCVLSDTGYNFLYVCNLDTGMMSNFLAGIPALPETQVELLALGLVQTVFCFSGL